MFPTLIVFSIWLSYFDLRYHRITNRSLGILFVGLSVALLVENSEFHVVSSVLVSLISVIGYKYGLGAGDVKLATVIIKSYYGLRLAARYLVTKCSGVSANDLSSSTRCPSLCFNFD